MKTKKQIITALKRCQKDLTKIRDEMHDILDEMEACRDIAHEAVEDVGTAIDRISEAF